MCANVVQSDGKARRADISKGETVALEQLGPVPRWIWQIRSGFYWCYMYSALSAQYFLGSHGVRPLLMSAWKVPADRNRFYQMIWAVIISLPARSNRDCTWRYSTTMRFSGGGSERSDYPTYKKKTFFRRWLQNGRDLRVWRTRQYWTKMFPEFVIQFLVGSISRITNWGFMSAAEQAKTRKISRDETKLLLEPFLDHFVKVRIARLIISARNEKRRAILVAKGNHGTTNKSVSKISKWLQGKTRSKQTININQRERR